MIKTSLGLGFVFALFSSIAGAASLDTTQIQISSQVYAEDPCNFTYATRGAFSIEVDVASIEAQLGQSVTEVEVIYGYFGRWTKEFQLDKNPQRVEMARSEDNASRFVVTFSDFLAKKGRFQHDGIDFLFRAELDGGEVVGCTSWYGIEPGNKAVAIGYTYIAPRVRGGGAGLAELQRLFDGALIDLVQNGVGGLTIEGEVTGGELALRPRVWDLFDQNHDVGHGGVVLLAGVARPVGRTFWVTCADHSMLLVGNFWWVAPTP
jgi:hypothetical protein